VASIVSALHPADGERIRPVDLLSREGLHRLLTGLVPNFTGFAPLGAVLVSLIGIGVAEHSGLIGAALRRSCSPRRVGAHAGRGVRRRDVEHGERDRLRVADPARGADVQGAGRHPIVGMAAAFAGVSGGFSANLLIGLDRSAARPACRRKPRAGRSRLHRHARRPTGIS
jgi:aminobenzoyl-glutamate transport protein